MTKAGKDLRNVVEAVGIWGQRWVETEATLENLDPELLMWDIRRNIDPRPMPRLRTTIQIIFKNLAKARQNWWLIVQPAGTSICAPSIQDSMWISTCRPTSAP